MKAGTLLQFEKVQKVCNRHQKMKADTFLQFEKVPKLCNSHQKSTGHVFEQIILANVTILGGPGDFPYCRRCVLASQKREQAELVRKQVCKI